MARSVEYNEDFEKEEYKENIKYSNIQKKLLKIE